MPDALAATILALAVAHAPPGRSPYSFEPVASCGTQASSPACPLTPVCGERAFFCKPPKWSDARGAWVRTESAPTATCRYARIADAVADTARRLHDCRDEQGVAIPGCELSGWPGTTESLALAMLTVALHESGLREDVQKGIPPLGRGAGGGVCLIQVRPSQAPRYASWLSDSERAELQASAEAQERFAQTLLGDDPQALRRCFEVGGRMLARSRKACEAARVPWDHGMFSMYGTGATCTHQRVGTSRKRTFSRLVAAARNLTAQALPTCSP